MAESQADQPHDPAGTVAVFAPSPLLTVTIEAGTGGPEVHLHPGGQGFWVAHLAAMIGAEVILCCALGGEPGQVIRGLLEKQPLTLRASDAATSNGVYVHDRRSGERVEVASVEAGALARHAADELYGIALGAGLDCDVTLLTGTQPPEIVTPDLYRRLAHDLRGNGHLVIADLTGAALQAALEGGIDLLKISDEELISEGYAAANRLDEIAKGARSLQAAGARNVLVSRASAPALLVDEAPSDPTELVGPVFEPLDHHGAGDSMFAATGVGLARGLELRDALRLGMAAGALNTTRRGLGTGTREEIERLARHVEVKAMTLGVDPLP